MSTLKELLNDTYYDKLLPFNISTSHRCHTEHLHKHKKKFQNLIDQHKVPYINPYDSIKVFNISAPSFTGIISQQKPVIREDINVVKNTVINLSDEALKDEETQLLSLGLKFCHTSEEDSVAKTSSKLESWCRVSCYLWSSQYIAQQQTVAVQPEYQTEDGAQITEEEIQRFEDSASRQR